MTRRFLMALVLALLVILPILPFSGGKNIDNLSRLLAERLLMNCLPYTPVRLYLKSI